LPNLPTEHVKLDEEEMIMSKSKHHETQPTTQEQAVNFTLASQAYPAECEAFRHALAPARQAFAKVRQLMQKMPGNAAFIFAQDILDGMLISDPLNRDACFAYRLDDVIMDITRAVRGWSGKDTAEIEATLKALKRAAPDVKRTGVKLAMAMRDTEAFASGVLPKDLGYQRP
jgi:uncharacterized membrane protein